MSSLSIAGGKFSCLTVPAVERMLWHVEEAAWGGIWVAVAVWAGAGGVLPWPHSPLCPHSPLSFPQQPQHFSVSTKDAAVENPCGSADSHNQDWIWGKISLFKPQKLLLESRSLSFLSAAPLLQNQFDLIRIFQQGMGIFIPLRHLSIGMEVLLHPHKPTAAS